ncbi:MAG: DUF3502 domain-containing protein [Oscillospiraceae bacterium]|nr:DUF3502 domain-containing protein [Oscillospiraceae bacterium]
MKKVTILFLAALMVISMASCGSPTTGGNTTAEAQTTAAAPAQTTTAAPAQTTSSAAAEEPAEREMVDLVFYWQGDGRVDNERVWTALNELTADAIQTTATHNLISWSNSNGIDLLIASGDYVDATYASAGAYGRRVQQGAYAELTEEMMLAHMPDLYAKIPMLAWAQATIDGKVYAIPNISEEWSYYRAIALRGDLREKYGVPEITSVDILEQYLQEVADNEPGILPWDANAGYAYYMRQIVMDQEVDWMFCSQNMSMIPGYGYETRDDSGELFNVYDTKEFHDYLAKMVDWRKRGFWSANALNNDKRQQDSFQNGTSAIAMENNGTVASWVRQANTAHPDWEAEFYDSANNGGFTVLQTSFLNNSFCIMSVSDQVGRAMEWLQFLKCNDEAFMLMRSGIEGEHWIDEGPGLMSTGPKSGDYGDYTNWWMSQVDMHRQATDALPVYLDNIESYKNRTFVNKVYYFLFNQEPVAAEIAAMTNITSEYLNGLFLGMYDDWEGTLATMQAAYDSAGRQKVVDEYNSQLAAHLENFVLD